MSDAPGGSVQVRTGAPDDWVPVEHRLAGLDRRTVAPALGVFLFLVFLGFGLPAINDLIAVDNPVQPGDVLNAGSGVTITPAVGWNIDSGLRTTDQTGNAAPELVVLTNGTAAVTAKVDSFAGTPAELIDQVDSSTVGVEDIANFQLVTDRRTITTASGLQGVAQGFTGTETQGVIAAFVVDGHGIWVVAYGNHDDLSLYADDIEAMIDSITDAPVPKVAP